MDCKNCGRPIAKILDPWGGEHGWFHIGQPDYSWEGEEDGYRGDNGTSCLNDEETEAEPIEVTGPEMYMNYFSLPLDEHAACLVAESFDLKGNAADTDTLTGRMDKMICDCLAVLKNRQAIRKGFHISNFWWGASGSGDRQWVEFMQQLLEHTPKKPVRQELPGKEQAS
jgi:hypothetical protein